MIQLNRAIRYAFHGQTALTKTFIGAVMVLLMPLLFLSGFVLLGYQVRIIRDVLDGRDEELPEWNNLPGDFVRGLVVFLGSVLYYVPSFILVGAGITSGSGVIDSFISSLNPLHPTSPTYDRGALSMLCLTFALALIWLLLSAPLIMAAVARYAETGEASAFLRVLELADEVWDRRGAAGQLAFNLLLLTVLAQIAGMLASITCFASVYVQFIQFAAVSHLTGQWGKVLKDHRPRPTVIRPIKPRA